MEDEWAIGPVYFAPVGNQIGVRRIYSCTDCAWGCSAGRHIYTRLEQSERMEHTPIYNYIKSVKINRRKNRIMN